MGVCGGVLSGRPACGNGGGAEFVAVTDGTEPSVGVGLFMTVQLELEPGPEAEVEIGGMPVETCVMDEVAEPVGLVGRAGVMGVVVEVVVQGGVGAENVGFSLEREGDVAKVGVGRGVVVVEEVVETCWTCWPFSLVLER